MPIDGDIDYSACSQQQLDEALRNIAASDYPINDRRLKEELARRAAGPPAGSVLPERLEIESRTQMIMSGAFSLSFACVGLAAATLWALAPESFPVRSDPRLLGLALIAGVLGAGGFVSSRRECRLTLVRDQLELSRGRQTIRVALADVEDLQWVSDPKGDPRAELLLKSDTPLGKLIHIVPLTAAPVERLMEILSCQRGIGNRDRVS